MIKSFLFITFIFFYTSSFSQTFKNDSVRSFVDQSINLIRSNAVDTSNVELIESKLYDKAKDLNSVSDVVPLYTEVFELLNDHHGGLKYKGKTYGWNKPAGSVNSYLQGKLKTEKTVVSQVIDKKQPTSGYREMMTLALRRSTVLPMTSQLISTKSIQPRSKTGSLTLESTPVAICTLSCWD